ncbi:MAG: UDP-glucose 4-epimerase [Candidatus Anoxychlamydiales bacterium]|nr:UDP-glucose 4-epimerase [Candidatus Anoxychlamydiales bacterium]
MKENILVTGGAGYIGSQNCKELYKNNFHPITFDNLSTGRKDFVKWGELIQEDLKDFQKIDEAIKKYKPKAVMHFAANALVAESIKDPQKYYENNVLATLNLLKAMLKNSVKYLIFSSSCATYGMPKFSPIIESHPQDPISAYGRTKYMIEQILKDYEKAYDFNYVSLRYFNAAGADLEAEVGENRDEETHLIPLAIDTALKKIDKLNVYGFDYDTKDGTAIRDYIHIQDLASAHLKALFYLFSTNRSVELNLGSDNGYSILEIIDEIEKHTNTKIDVKRCSKREGDPAILFANSSKAKKILGWKAQNSDLKTIITSAIKWHKKKNLL